MHTILAVAAFAAATHAPAGARLTTTHHHVGAQMVLVHHRPRIRVTRPTQALQAPAPISFHLVAPGTLPDAPLVELALTDQMAQVAAVWHTPAIRFSTTGIPIYIASRPQTDTVCGDEASGCHAFDHPAIYIQDFDGNQDDLTIALSHEIIEAVVDPDATRPEICDPVNWQRYTVDGVSVSDWAYPSYFHHGEAPFDHLQLVSAPGTPNTD